MRRLVQIKAKELAERLGAAKRSGKSYRCVCPVHGSRTGDSATLALRDGKDGLLVFCHAGCSAESIFAELRRRGLLGRPGWEHRTASNLAPAINPDDARRRIRLAQRIWDRSQDARGTPAALYFLSRGIDICRLQCVRYSPSLRRPDGTYGPAVVARVVDVDGKLIGVHRTWLFQDELGLWRRRDRASLGPIRGGAVRLAPAAKTLIVGEGLESSGSAMLAAGTPAWAALSTSGLKSLILPPIVLNVIVLADHDVSGAGQTAAWIAAQRWLAEGRSVRIALPPKAGTDFNDLLLGKPAAQITTENVYA